MKRSRRKKEIKRNLLVSDFICRRCRVQPTCENDHICEICKAIGKSSEPVTENVSWQDIMLAPEITREVFLWFKKRRLVRAANKPV